MPSLRCSISIMEEKPGEWIPNITEAKKILEAIEFLKHMNSIVHHLYPHALICAEESTSFQE